MSSVDKLHKLYTTTVGPVVWARSIGVEVLNELDSIKAALMMTAGAQSQTTNAGLFSWSTAAKGVETLAAAANAGKALSGGLLRTLGNSLQNLTEAAQRSRKL
jgi:ubiquinone biosynthesis monooxygenase Coq6